MAFENGFMENNFQCLRFDVTYECGCGLTYMTKHGSIFYWILETVHTLHTQRRSLSFLRFPQWARRTCSALKTSHDGYCSCRGLRCAPAVWLPWTFGISAVSPETSKEEVNRLPLCSMSLRFQTSSVWLLLHFLTKKRDVTTFIIIYLLQNPLGSGSGWFGSAYGCHAACSRVPWAVPVPLTKTHTCSLSP